MDFQSTLFAPAASQALGFETVERHELSRGAWVDVARGWLPEPDDVFETLVRDVPWRADRRQMYDRVVDVPRLLHTYMIGEVLPHARLTEAREALSAHYADELGEPFRTAGCCYYRDGRDSVAWHGDTIGRGKTTDTMVAIVSVGDPRRLHLRPRLGGADPVVIEMGHGDLVTMGGSCQRTWEHAVPKVAHAGPRISVQFRPFNVF
jgi:alkylated DNA repair dioxygenase AlkB